MLWSIIIITINLQRLVLIRNFIGNTKFSEYITVNIREGRVKNINFKLNWGFSYWLVVI